MNFMSYIFGLISSVLTAIIVVLLNQRIDWEIHSLSILFIIPVGGILLGASGASGYILSKKLSNSKMNIKDYFGVIFLGLLTFFNVNYISYSTSYVGFDANHEMKIISQFSQPKNHISISSILSFVDYMDFVNSSSTLFLVESSMQNEKGFEVGETTTTVLFYIQIIGVLLGSLGISLYLGNIKYCDKCKRYYKDKILKKFDVEKYDVYARNINKSMNDGVSLKKVINEINEKDNKEKKYGQIELLYCPGCFEANLLIKFFVINSKGEFDEILNMEQIILLEQVVAKELSKK